MRLFYTSLLSAALVLSTSVYAASFESLEQSAARLGNADAGTATNTKDAAIEFYNPAGMAFVKHPEIAASLIGVIAKISMYDAKATSHNFLNNSTVNVTGRSKGPKSEAPLPALHVIQPINNRLSVGFGATLPYGLETIYKKNSIARYFATTSKIDTINLGLSIAYKILDNLSIGLGFDMEKMDAKLGQAFSINPAWKDFFMMSTGSDWGYGFNGGIFYQATPKTRFGIAYRSAIKHHIDGTAKLYYGKYHLINTKGISSMTMPATTTLSMQHNMTKNWLVLADIQYTEWSCIKDLVLRLTKFKLPYGIPLHYHNAWRFALGQSYKVNSKFTLRNGFAFDETPTNETYKTARIPGANRYWITIGGNYKFTPKLNFDLGYAFILFEHSRINLIDPVTKATLNARYKAYAQLFGAQLNYQLPNVL